MKHIILYTLGILLLALFVGCSKENDDTGIGENQFRANINGKDSVYTITKATLQTFSDHKQLSIITSLSGTSFDLYVNAPEITAKEYPIANPFNYHYPTEYSSCYYRWLYPNSYFTARAFVSTVVATDYKTTITEINGNVVKGTVRFKAEDQGYFTSGEVMIDASFSTNLLELIP